MCYTKEIIVRNLIYCFLIILLFSCADRELEKSKMIATDYLYAQRAYPYGEIDLAAYQKAIEKRRIYYRINRGPFDNSWNALGPTNICGRITDLEIPSDRANAVYAGTASGGIFISEDKGDTWQAIFDEQSSLAIGDIAISKTNPDRLYVGTGEANAGGASIAYDGLGVFRSDDKGQNWTHLGLEKVMGASFVCI